MKPAIHIHLDNKGNMKIVDVTGAGTACTDVTAHLEKLVGRVDESSRASTGSLYVPVQEAQLDVTL